MPRPIEQILNYTIKYLIFKTIDGVHSESLDQCTADDMEQCDKKSNERILHEFLRELKNTRPQGGFQLTID